MASTVLSNTQFFVISGVLVLGVLVGLILMSKPEKARFGNGLSAACTLVAIAVTMYNYKILPSKIIWASIAIGVIVSLIAAAKVKMIQMPQVVALLNGFGGLASALVAILSVMQATDRFSSYTAAVALVIGFVTFTGSLVAAGKLHKLLPQKPVVIPGHTVIIVLLIVATVVCVALNAPIWITAILASAFGIIFAIRVGGADMPITISLLNSLSGVAGGIVRHREDRAAVDLAENVEAFRADREGEKRAVALDLLDLDMIMANERVAPVDRGELLAQVLFFRHRSCSSRVKNHADKYTSTAS